MPNPELPWWGRGYIGAVAVLGLGTLAHSLYSFYNQPIGLNWFVLAALTVLTGSATVKLPTVPATISISETFVFTSTLLYGPAAGTLTVALDALVISFTLARKGHPAYRLLFNICALPASLWVGAHLFFWSLGLPPLAAVPATRGSIIIPNFVASLILFTTCYFALNSWSIAIAIAIEKRLPPFKVWKENFAWLSLNYFGGASVAALLVIYSRDLDYGSLLALLYFTFSTAMGRAEDTNRHLSQLNRLYMSTIETLAMAIDAKDQITHGHIRRVQHYAVALAKRVGVTDLAQISAIEAASLLHDMGKLAVPEYILNKPGALTPAEFEKMKLHASVGADILGAIEFPYPVVPIVRHHHENWDGSGYPDGLKGTEIPIGARILSVVDCFDALTSDRPYRPRLPDSEAIKILLQRRGSMYDPLVVDTFIAIHPELMASAEHQIGPQKEGLSAITRGSLSASTSGTPTQARLDEINASTEETVVLYELARGLSGQLTFEEAGDVASKHLRRLVPVSICVFFMYDENKDDLVCRYSTGEHAGHFADLRIPRGQRLSGWVAANRMSVLNSDPVLDLGEPARSMRAPLRSCLSTPIVVFDSLFGVLTVYSTQRDAFTENHLRIAEAISAQIGPILKASLSSDKRDHKLQRDYSTNFDLQPIETFSADGWDPQSFRSGFAIVQVDVSIAARPKSGMEQILSLLAAEVRAELRNGDRLLRVGDTGLLALLPDCDSETAFGIASTIRDRLPAIAARRGIMANVLVGVATAPADGTALTGLIEKARRRAVDPGHRDRRGSVH
jgi:putative nucleotidyltransferase with HDIG domain